jgi:hypothetical protein
MPLSQGFVKYIFSTDIFSFISFQSSVFCFSLPSQVLFFQITFFLSPRPFPFCFYFFLSCSSAFFPPFLPSPFLFSSSYASALFSIPYTLSSPGTFVLTSFSPFYSHSFFFLLLSPLPSIATLLSGSWFSGNISPLFSASQTTIMH